jgi:DNA-binding CsgD family transcriptional regulator
MTNAASCQQLSRDHGRPRWPAIAFKAKDPARSALNHCAEDEEAAFSRGEAQGWASSASRLAQPSVLAKKIGLARACGAMDALTRIGTAALLIDMFGRCRHANPAAESLFDGDFGVSQGRLRASDPKSNEKLHAFVSADGSDRSSDRAMVARAPVVVARRHRLPLILEALPLDSGIAHAFGGAAMLVTITDMESRPAPSEQLLTASFGLTPAEARLASALASGATMDEAADALSVTRETARTRLKVIFAKTGTGRQAKLVALLSRLPASGA